MIQNPFRWIAKGLISATRRSSLPRGKCAWNQDFLALHIKTGSFAQVAEAKLRKQAIDGASLGQNAWVWDMAPGLQGHCRTHAAPRRTVVPRWHRLSWVRHAVFRLGSKPERTRFESRRAAKCSFVLHQRRCGIWHGRTSDLHSAARGGCGGQNPFILVTKRLIEAPEGQICTSGYAIFFAMQRRVNEIGPAVRGENPDK